MSNPQGPPPGCPPTDPTAGYPPLPPPSYAPQPDKPPHPQVYAQQPTSTPNVVVVSQPGVVINPGGCKACGSVAITDAYTCCGICLAICCFPIGILCCVLMREKKCANCGVRYG